MPQFENYTRRFDKALSQNANEKIAFHYYIQQSIRNVLRRLQQNRYDIIKRTLQDNNLLPPQKDIMRSYYFFLNVQLFVLIEYILFRYIENVKRFCYGTIFNNAFRRT